MTNPIKIYMEWEKRRWQTQGIKAWESQRTKGKWQFVLKMGLLWSLSMLTGITLYDYLVHRSIRLENLVFNLLLFISLGFVFALTLWRLTESKYQKYLKNNP